MSYSDHQASISFATTSILYQGQDRLRSISLPRSMSTIPCSNCTSLAFYQYGLGSTARAVCDNILPIQNTCKPEATGILQMFVF